MGRIDFDVSHPDLQGLVELVGHHAALSPCSSLVRAHSQQLIRSVNLSFVTQRLDKNELKNLPESIAELPVLMSLRFRENAVVKLHDCFSKLTTLQVTPRRGKHQN